MGKFKYLITALVLFFISLTLTGESYSQDSIIICKDYQSFNSALKSGKTASFEKLAYLDEYSLMETSLITIHQNTPLENQFRIDMKILDLSNMKNPGYGNNSILGFLFSDCEKFKSEYKNLINTSCSIITDTLDQALKVAWNGISKNVYESYDIEGEIIRDYGIMCMKIRPKPVKKPAIYLYPEKNMNIKVSVLVNGKLTKSEPEYNIGWDVFSTRESIINEKYDYLFYEADLNKIELTDEGWVVKFENLENWFNEYLPALGLNEKETLQFKEYWMKELKKTNYYEIRLLDDNFLNENMKLIISPEPKTLIRLNFYFRPVIRKSYIREPEITKRKREGFTVVEWGGINENDLKIIP